MFFTPFASVYVCHGTRWRCMYVVCSSCLGCLVADFVARIDMIIVYWREMGFSVDLEYLTSCDDYCTAPTPARVVMMVTSCVCPVN